MWRRAAVLGVLAVAGAAQLAFGGDAAPTGTIRLPALSRCVHHGSVRVTLAPALGASFSSVSVRVGASEVLQLASLGGPASVRVTLPRRPARVRVTATTSDGQFVEAGRSYRRCTARRSRPAATPTPVPTPRPRPLQGGSTD